MDLKFPRVIEEGRSPTVNDDESQGIIIGQPWVDVNTNDYFICTDVTTGSALWDKIASMADLEAVIDNAPDVLDTLRELSTALQDNPAVITDIQSSLTSMLSDITSLQGQVSGPPVSHSHTGDEIVQDATHRFVTDTQIVSWNSGTGGGGGLGVGTVVNVSADHNAAAGEFIAVDAIAPINITLPSSPSVGDVLIVNDAEGKAHINPITILRNGNPIQNLDEDFVLNISNGQVTFTYDSTGWLADLGGDIVPGSIDPRLLYPWKVINTNYDAQPLDRLIADSSASEFTINLPTNPIQGTQVEISPGSDWSNNKIIINSLQPIIGLTQPLDLDTPRSVVMIYTATDYGWTVANYNNSSLIGVIGEAPEPWKIIENNYLAHHRDRLVLKASGPFTVTLPLNPLPGNEIQMIPGSNWGDNNISIDNNGKPIYGVDQGLILDISRPAIFVYTDDTYGWTIANYGDTSVVVETSGTPGTSEKPWSLKTANYNATNGDRIIADTSSGTFNINMPVDPILGQQVKIAPGNDWSTNIVSVVSANLFHGQPGPFTLNTSKIVEFVYSTPAYGWVITL